MSKVQEFINHLINISGLLPCDAKLSVSISEDIKCINVLVEFGIDGRCSAMRHAFIIKEIECSNGDAKMLAESAIEDINIAIRRFILQNPPSVP